MEGTVDDLAYRRSSGKTIEQTLLTRAARFKLFDDERSDPYQIIDDIFSDVPGMDNIPSDNLTQATVDNTDLFEASEAESRVPLRSGYYHRLYRFTKRGALGQTVNFCGFNDDNMWVAQTTQSLVAPVSIRVCRRRRRGEPDCHDVENRFSYAVPLEILYMTPLLSWNPYDLEIHEDFEGATSNGENGRDVPYNGADMSHYYLTPYEFFSGSRDRDRDTADTARASVEVLDRNNNVHSVVSSGTSILLPEIADIGQVRLRYPIAPISNEGSSVWKELNALKDVVQQIEDDLDRTATNGGVESEIEPENVYFQMSYTAQDPPGEHTHEFYVPFRSFRNRLLNGRAVTITTEERQGHSHVLRLNYDRETDTFRYIRCDNQDLCSDGHPRVVILTTRNRFTVPQPAPVT